MWRVQDCTLAIAMLRSFALGHQSTAWHLLALASCTGHRTQRASPQPRQSLSGTSRRPCTTKSQSKESCGTVSVLLLTRIAIICRFLISAPYGKYREPASIIALAVERMASLLSNSCVWSTNTSEVDEGCLANSQTSREFLHMRRYMNGTV